MAVWSRAARSFGLRLLLGAFFACVATHAAAQANYLFNGGGTVVSSSATVLQQELIRGSGLTWAVGDSGYVARATAAANASLYSQGGTTFRLAGTAATRVAANDLAASAIGGLRAGLPGLVASVVLSAALTKAQEYFDATRMSMVYNAPATLTTDPSGFTKWTITGAGQDGKTFGSISDAAGSLCAYLHGITNTTWTYTIGAIQNQTATQIVYSVELYENGNDKGTQTAVGQGTLLQSYTCPGGGSASGATCPQVVDDATAASKLAPQITATNGSGIGQAITNAGGQVQGSQLPSVSLNPSAGPTTTTPDAGSSPQTQTQTSQNAIPSCVNNLCAVSIQTTKVQLDANGNPTNAPVSVTTTSPGAGQSSPADDSPTCGGSGNDCNVKVDETGTPSSATPLPNANALDAPSTDRLNSLPSIVDSTQRDTSLPDVLIVPPVQGCTPFQMPGGLPVIDPCGPMEEVRTIMDYLWALAGFWIIIGMVKRSSDGG